MGNLARNSRLLAALVLALCVVGSAAGAASDYQAQLVEHWDGTRWSESKVRGPNGSTDLAAVTAISATDVWAVGTSWHGSEADSDYWSYPIAERWSGSSWQTMRLPTTSRTAPYTLDDVSAAAANDVWAVGGSVAGTLLEHWNGKRWSRLASPDRWAEFSGVAALSRHDVWLVGMLVRGKAKMLVEHWNGRAWQRVATPDSNGVWPSGIAADSTRDIGVVGGELLLHWNGVRWNRVAAEPPAAHNYSLDAVTAISARDAWAVGSAGSKSLVEHWNRHRWRIVSAAAFQKSSFGAIAAANAHDIWGVGTTGNPTHPFAAHWDGKSWTVDSPKNAAGNSDTLTGVAAVAAGDAWAVGSTGFP